MKIRFAFGITIASLLFATRADAQYRPEMEFTERCYLVWELVTPQVPLGPNGDVATTEGVLMRQIRDQVAPATWDTAGGRGAMAYESKQRILRVLQTEANHAKLKTFLKNLKKCDVSVAVRIFSISLKQWDDSQRARLAWTESEGIKHCVLSEVELCSFFHDAQEHRSSHIMQTPYFKLADGQEGKVKIGEWFWSGPNGISSPMGALSPPPDTEEFFAGVEGRFVPKLSADRKEIGLQIEFAIRNVNSEAAAVRKRVVPAFTELKVAASTVISDRHTIAFWMGTTQADEAPRPVLSKLPFRTLATMKKELNEQAVILLVTPQIAAEPGSFRVQRLEAGVQSSDATREPQVISRVSR